MNSNRRRHRSWTSMACCFALLCAGGSSVGKVAAQQPSRDGRRQFVEGLLQALIDSQLDRGRPPGRPSTPADPQLAAVRKHLDGFSRHSGDPGQSLERPFGFVTRLAALARRCH